MPRSPSGHLRTHLPLRGRERGVCVRACVRVPVYARANLVRVPVYARANLPLHIQAQDSRTADTAGLHVPVALVVMQCTTPIDTDLTESVCVYGCMPFLSHPLNSLSETGGEGVCFDSH